MFASFDQKDQRKKAHLWVVVLTLDFWGWVSLFGALTMSFHLVDDQKVLLKDRGTMATDNTSYNQL